MILSVSEHETPRQDAGVPCGARILMATCLQAALRMHASRTHTVIEVNGRDRQGLLYDLTRALSALNLQIGSAHITTFGETAVDVFYVKDVFGLQITHESKLKQIHADLLAVMTEEVGADDADDPPTDGLDRSAADPADRMPSTE